MSSYPQTLQEWNQLRADLSCMQLDQLVPMREKFTVPVDRGQLVIDTLELLSTMLQQQLDNIANVELDSVSTANKINQGHQNAEFPCEPIHVAAAVYLALCCNRTTSLTLCASSSASGALPHAVPYESTLTAGKG
jgi:hypothetical protein